MTTREVVCKAFRQNGYVITVYRSRPHSSFAVCSGHKIDVALADHDDENSVLTWAVRTAQSGRFRPLRTFGLGQGQEEICSQLQKRRRNYDQNK